MEQVLRLEQAALAASEVLEAAGVRHLLLKGAALATAVYADPSLRPFGDVDLLLEPGRFGDAIAALRAAGAVRPFPEVRRGFDRRFAKDVPVLFGGGALDLHRTLIAGPFGRRIPVGELVERGRESRHRRTGDVDAGPRRRLRARRADGRRGATCRPG